MVDLNMRKSWRAAQALHPNAVVFLGDMMDNGRMDYTADEYVCVLLIIASIYLLHLDLGNLFDRVIIPLILNRSFVVPTRHGLLSLTAAIRTLPLVHQSFMTCATRTHK